MSFVLIVVLTWSFAWLAMRIDRDDGMLMAPAVSVSVISIALALLVDADHPVETFSAPLWLALGCSFALSGAVAWKRGILLDGRMVLPTLCALGLLSTYLLHGMANYVGSWFWDGFNYLAAAETLSRYPRHALLPGLEPLYDFGQETTKLRYIASAWIAFFKGVVPWGGDVQSASGYFLLMCAAVFAWSNAYLAAKTFPGRRATQATFVVVTSFSGIVLNLIWANNFDNLLALALCPALLGLAMTPRWDLRRAVLIALLVAALVNIYPEMSALMAMPAAIIIAIKLVQDRTKTALLFCAVLLAVLAILLAPTIGGTIRFFIGQLSHSAATVRPGEGYFPTYLNLRCAPGALIALYSPFDACQDRPIDYVRSVVGIIFIAFAVAGAAMRRDALAASGCVLAALSAYALLWHHYDYGAFKILTAGWCVFALLAMSALDRIHVARQPILAVVWISCTVFMVGKLMAFDKVVLFKDIGPMRELRAAAPGARMIGLKIEDFHRFQWIEFYLKDRPSVAIAGRFTYREPPATPDPHVLRRIGEVDYIITDDGVPRACVWAQMRLCLYPAR